MTSKNNYPSWNYRHGLELLVRYGTILGIIAILIVGGIASAGTLSAGIIVMFIISYFRNRINMKNYARSATLITPTSYPGIHQLIEYARGRVRVPDNTEFYIQNSDVLNAYAIGFSKPHKVILNSALIDNFNDKELLSIIGHEMGHIRFGHTSWSLITGVFESQAHRVLGLGTLMRFIFLFLSRLNEYSADRAGLISCGSLHAAISAELKLNMAGKEPSPAQIQTYSKLNSAPDDTLWEDAGELIRTHPTMKGRIQALLKFANSKNYKNYVKMNTNSYLV